MKKHMIRWMATLLLVLSAAALSHPAAAADSDQRLFQDVTDPQSVYFDAVYFLKAKRITAGFNTQKQGLSFRPGISCRRADFSLLLWKLCGRPAGSMANPYSDIDQAPNSSFYKAIMWIAEKNQQAGIHESEFRPNDSIRRKEALVMLWRAEGSPAVLTEVITNTDADAARDPGIAQAALWAYQNSLINSFDDEALRQDEPLLRGDAALLLYRYAMLKNCVGKKELAQIEIYRACGDTVPDPSTGLSKYVSLSPGIEIGDAGTLYEFPNADSARFTPKASFGFQNYAFGYTHTGNTPIALLAFNNKIRTGSADILVAWDMESNSEYAVLGRVDFDHGNAVVYDPKTRTFFVNTGTGPQKTVIEYIVQDGIITELSRTGLAEHMSVYNAKYVASGIVSLKGKGYAVQYAEPHTDDRMFAWYEAFADPPYAADADSYRHHEYDYTGQSMYKAQVGEKQYLGFLYQTWSYYEEDGSVKSFRQGKADLYDLENMHYVGTQWFDSFLYEIESASIFNDELYVAYSEGNKVFFYKADIKIR